MVTLGRALLNELDDGDLDALAECLAPRLASRLAQPSVDENEWLDTKRAAGYLGISVNSLHKLTAERAIPFDQEGPGCKCWFKRSEVDAWRRGEWKRGIAERNG